MTQPTAAPEVYIGACLACNAVILVTPVNPICRLCGRPPAHTLPFDDDERLAAAVEPAPTEPTPEPAPPASEEPLSDHDIFIGLILDYLDSGPTNEAIVRESFEAAGADPEAAATAVGRLRAVRDLIRQLQPDTEIPVVPPTPSEPASAVAAEVTNTSAAAPAPDSTPGPPTAPDVT